MLRYALHGLRYVWAEMFAGQGSEDFWVGLDDQLNEGDFRYPAIYRLYYIVHAPLQYCGIALLL